MMHEVHRTAQNCTILQGYSSQVVPLYILMHMHIIIFHTLHAKNWLDP